MKYKENKFPSRLKEVRNENKLSQRQLAKLLNFSQAMIALWESGERDPNTRDLIRLCQVLNVSADYLLGLED